MRRLITSLLVFILAFFIFSTSYVSAKIISEKSGNVNIAKTEIVNDDLFIGAPTVRIDGVVNGDVFIGAQTVIISGVVNGNLHVGTNTLDLSGRVTGNVYAGAQNVLISNSSIGGSLLTGASTVNVDETSTIGGSVLAGAGVLSIDSQVKRSVYAGAGSLTIGENTYIGKDLYYASDREGKNVNISNNAIIAGTTYKSAGKTMPKIDTQSAKKFTSVFYGARVFTSILSFLGALLVGFLYFKFFNKHFNQTAKIVSKSFWKSLGLGFLIMIAFIPGIVILLITVIGIPLAGLIFLTFLFYMYLAKIVVGSAFGNWISQKFKWKVSTYMAFAIGLFAILILKLVPFIGFLAGLVVLWSGLGALTLRTFSKPT